MPVASLREIVDRAFEERYGVAAINVVNDLTLEAVLAAAEELDAPLIVQTSVKTVKSIGAKALFAMWQARRGGARARRAAPRPLPGPRGHQPLPEHGLELGAVRRVEAERRGEQAPDDRGRRRGRGRYGAQVEGEIESVRGVEDMVGDDERASIHRSRDGRLHHRDRGLRLRAGDRQRPRHVQGRAQARPSASPISSRRPRSRWRSTAAPA